MVLLTDVLEHVADDFQLFSSSWPRHGQGLFPAHRSGRPERFGASTIWHLGITGVTIWSASSRFGRDCRSGRCSLRTSTRGCIRSSRRFGLGIAAVDEPAGWPEPISGCPTHGATDCSPGASPASGTAWPAWLKASRCAPYRFGVSLMALLRREEGPIEPRRKPFVSSRAIITIRPPELVTADV